MGGNTDSDRNVELMTDREQDGKTCGDEDSERDRIVAGCGRDEGADCGRGGNVGGERD